MLNQRLILCWERLNNPFKIQDEKKLILASSSMLIWGWFKPNWCRPNYQSKIYRDVKPTASSSKLIWEGFGAQDQHFFEEHPIIHPRDTVNHNWFWPPAQLKFWWHFVSQIITLYLSEINSELKPIFALNLTLLWIRLFNPRSTLCWRKPIHPSKMYCELKPVFASSSILIQRGFCTQ